MAQIDIDNTILDRYYRDILYRTLTEESWFFTLDNYLKIPDTRPRWKRIYDKLHWLTIGRFRAWLHRDCGEW